MREYTVQQGETLEAIVAREGRGISLQAVRDANPALLAARKEDQLRPGDIVRFPDEEGDPPLLVVATGMQYQFVVKSPRRKVRLRICMKGGEPYRGVAYALEVEGEQHQGTTDGEGFLEHEIPGPARKGKLTIDEQERELHLGALDPIHTKTGIQARLSNLGYALGAVDGKFGPKTIRAIKAFQYNNKLQVDGEAGPITRDKLVELHGC
ncbi:MAG TPA: peptidoglycan-binding protein [Polyangiaceae bacterium]|nr:peptidoglycan-binding protein [Polyangiaceae bacterium]